MHDPLERFLGRTTRRRFFGTMAQGFGAVALGRLLGAETLASKPGRTPRAKRVISLHMEGGPSQIDLWDHKPGLVERFDEDLPPSIRGDQRITTMTSGQSRFPVAPSKFEFTRYPNRQDGVAISSLMPHTGAIADKLCFIHSMHTQAINHEPGITFFHTGSEIAGRPSFGSWLSYGLGNENEDLPSFVVLISQGQGNMQALASRFWGSGFLPSEHQGCRFRAGKDAVLYLTDPDGMTREDRRRYLDLVQALNEAEFEDSLDPEVEARIAQYEMAYRMQASVPELTDFSDESEETLQLYGPDVHKPGSFAANCLLARRMAERGVRFTQLFHRGWDQHGNLPNEMTAQAQAADQAQAALVTDLERRGLLDETIVLWAGEFGRTVYCQGGLTRENYGRDHHPRCFSVWVAGGGFEPGITYGRTDDYSYNIVENPVSVHDLHATMLHQLGIDHEALTYRHQGRDYRLTDVHGNVVRDLVT